MSELIQVDSERDYTLTLSQIKGLLAGERNLIANLSNIAAVLKENHGFFWVGFYLVENDQLVLGPFQGPVACTRIARGKGVCGSAWEAKKTVLVPDVHKFPGHIACSEISQSEIVVPLLDSKGGVLGVLDVDSDKKDDFNKIDQTNLEEIAALISQSNE